MWKPAIHQSLAVQDGMMADAAVLLVCGLTPDGRKTFSSAGAVDQMMGVDSIVIAEDGVGDSRAEGSG